MQDCQLLYTFAKKQPDIVMKANEQTIQQIERFLRKVAQKYPSTVEPTIMTDIHVRVTQESGDLMAFDDDDVELTRCVVEEWIGNNNDNFYEGVTTILRQSITNNKDIAENLGILKPYNFVLEDDDKANVAELYVVDDDTIILDGELMKGLDKDLNDFLKNLLS